MLIKGKVDRRGGGDEANLIVDEITPLEELDNKFTHGMRIRLDEAEHDETTVSKVREIVRGYPGSKELHLSMSLQEGETVHFRADKFKVEISPQLRERLDDLLGHGHYKLLMSKPQR